MRMFALHILLGAFLLVQPTARAEEGTHWGYEGENAPRYWGNLDTAFGACSTGKRQSPINLEGFTQADLPSIDFNYTANAKEIIHNGHAVQVNFPAGSSISISGQEYQLQQLHFHTPSENRIEQRPFAMEVHMVHADSRGDLAVIAVMLSEGTDNQTLAALWQQLPLKTGDSHILNSPVSALTLLPSKKDYYRFSGSLTTPPCSENVLWLVMKTTVTISKSQLKAFSKAIPFPNNRPVQAINGRQIQQ